VPARSVNRPLLVGVSLIALACCPLVEQKASGVRPVASVTSVVTPRATPQPLQSVPGTGLLRQPQRQIGNALSVVAAGKKAAKPPKSAKATLTANTESRSARPALSGLDLAAGSAAEQALSFALDQLGKPYVWGAEGPDTYDCSGLTMAAYESAGYQLPRTAADQAMVGTPVAVADLLPGDLLFYATNPSDLSTVHHVVMYAGAGMIVHAPHQGDVVRVGPMWLGEEYAGAVRIVDAAPALSLIPATVLAPHRGHSAAPAKHGKPSAAHPNTSPSPRPSSSGTPSADPTDVPGDSPTETPTQTPTVEPSTPATDATPSEEPTVPVVTDPPTQSPTEPPVESPAPEPSPSESPSITPEPTADTPVIDPVIVEGS
jgi:cell wall-associated NlpC family hydrolase